MKKTYLLSIVTAIVFLLQSCAKMDDNRNDSNLSANRVIPMETETKESNYLFAIIIGHLSKDCGGRCVTINGVNYHFDCMGEGHVCNRAVAVSLHQVGSAVTAVTVDTFDLTSENFFAMPDRSLEYIDANNEKIYLNIPAQTVYRDTATLQFTFTGLYFSNSAAYSNN